MKIIKQSAELIQLTPNALEFIESCGRTCYKSEGMICEGSAEKFVNKILTGKHESVLEHAVASFRFITDRGVTHEMVRHRLASYSQESTRYCNYSKDKFGNEITVILPVRFYIPYDYERSYSTIEPKHEHWVRYTTWCASLQTCEKKYFELLELGESPQEARDVLPNSLKTEIVMTANLREWLHFFKLRTAKESHPQMRDLALQAYDILKNKVKIIFEEL